MVEGSGARPCALTHPKTGSEGDFSSEAFFVVARPNRRNVGVCAQETELFVCTNDNLSRRCENLLLTHFENYMFAHD